MTGPERERLRAEIDRVQRGRLATLRHEPRFPWESDRAPSRDAEHARAKRARAKARRP
jgi:hypothetical protein